jgi:hypothetical protein
LNIVVKRFFQIVLRVVDGFLPPIRRTTDTSKRDATHGFVLKGSDVVYVTFFVNDLCARVLVLLNVVSAEFASESAEVAFEIDRVRLKIRAP